MKGSILRKALSLLGAAALAASPLATTPALAQSPKTLTVAIEANMPGFDPHVVCSYALYREILTMFEPLVAADLTDPDAMPPELVPALAERWEYSDDKTEVTFHLRKGVRFHDGTVVDADVVKWNFLRVWRPSEEEQAEHYYPVAAGPATFWSDSVEAVEVVDPHTVRVRLKHPWIEFVRQLYATSCGAFLITSPKAWEEHGQQGLANHPAGTGPYRFVEWVPGDRLVVERFDDYWGEPGKVDRIVFREFTNMAAMVAAFRRGELDIIPAVPPDNIESLRADGFNVATNLVPNMIYLELNHRHPALQDVRVRRAIAHAIDKEALAHGLLTGAAEAAHSIVSPGSPQFDPDFRSPPFDLEKARALMEEAGFGPDNRLRLGMPTAASGSGTIAPIPISLALQSDLRKIYIDVDVLTMDFYSFLDAGNVGLGGGNDLIPFPWGMSTAFWTYTVLHSSRQTAFNHGWYENDDVDRYLDAGAQALTMEESTANYQKANQIAVNEDIGVIPVLVDLSPTAYQPYVKNFVVPHENWFSLHQVDIER
jgi:peptide/nickel transport system substrate-binding protein